MKARFLKRGLLLTALGAQLFLAACGGGGGGGGTAAPIPVPVQTPSSATSSITVGAAASTPAIPAVGGISGSVSLPAATSGAGASVTATSSLNPPSGVVALTASVRSPQDVTTLFFYESFAVTTNITFGGTPGFTIAMPPGTNMSQNFYVAVWNGTTWDKVNAKQGTVTPGTTTVVFPSTSTPVSLTAGTTYYFAFYGVLVSTPAPTATPTIAPTATPTIAPTATPTVAPTATPTVAPTATPTVAPASIALTPSSLSFTSIGSTANQTFTASETGFTGTFTPGTCTSGTTTVATVTAGPNANQFTVTPQAAGTCNISVSDGRQTANVAVTVTTTTVGGN